MVFLPLFHDGQLLTSEPGKGTKLAVNLTTQTTLDYCMMAKLNVNKTTRAFGCSWKNKHELEVFCGQCKVQETHQSCKHQVSSQWGSYWSLSGAPSHKRLIPFLFPCAQLRETTTMKSLTDPNDFLSAYSCLKAPLNSVHSNRLQRSFACCKLGTDMPQCLPPSHVILSPPTGNC